MPRQASVYFKNQSIFRLFLLNAEDGRFSFGDGIRPTEKENSDIYTIYRDYMISYKGWVGHTLLKRRKGNAVRIDYG